ncbi:MAG TPA: sigma-E factor negative regulatory protein [Burkholderiales bacterium]|nr:sigma-E factor negative regulatory protein [Burkholderiales bacterium]HYA46881.1 sigma-E factor negative regulatory protein [Burkholderiales bacterium]
MNIEISALIDGEGSQRELDEALAALARDPQACECWRIYHLIGDAMHGHGLLSREFGAQLSDRLSREPTVVAPRAMRSRRERSRWVALSAAASVAAVALVGWLAYGPTANVVAPPVATVPPPIAEAKPKVPARVALPSATNDYLLAHQIYSPRVTLQGLAPYIRTVSDDVVEKGGR